MTLKININKVFLNNYKHCISNVIDNKISIDDLGSIDIVDSTYFEHSFPINSS
ncbi:hypothetical protein MUTS15_03540 [Escherichia coli]|nr:hypothetical protein MUTS15_03540 [Escherichia coli]